MVPAIVTGPTNAYPKDYIMDYMNGLENSHMFITEYSVYFHRNSEM